MAGGSVTGRDLRSREEDGSDRWVPVVRGRERGEVYRFGFLTPGGSWARFCSGPKGFLEALFLIFISFLLFLFCPLISFISFAFVIQIDSNQIVKFPRIQHINLEL
jgi:hypothetical protein